MRQDEDEKEEVIYCSCSEMKCDGKDKVKKSLLIHGVSGFVDMLHSAGSLE